MQPVIMKPIRGVVGVTGTRAGLTDAQRSGLMRVLKQPENAITKAVHGGCVGVDTEFHRMMMQLEVPIIVRPSTLGTELLPSDVLQRVQVMPMEDALLRNRLIVEDADYMIACPLELVPQTAGGTWHTIREAIRVGKPLVIIYSDGLTSTYNMEFAQ